ncbi:MAG: hypothetical protein K2Y23_18950 [Cyanobacteria bacterium]|nr:hypothetical protein [Cyanobacteriota bacterium]
MRSTITSGVIVGLGVALLLTGVTVARVQVDGPKRLEPIRPPAQPSSGRLSFDALIYQGAFRVPDQSSEEGFSYGGQTLAYNPVANTLFLNALNGTVAEVSIPAPVKAALAEQVPVATIVQPLRDPTDGHLRDIAESGVVLDGLLVHDGRLYGAGVIAYDASNSQRVSHFGRSLDLTRREVTRIHQVGETGKAGFVAGYMATVPPEWRAALGGAAVTGQCCLSIISRTSYGPGLFAWNPADLGNRDPVPAAPLLYYPQQHATLGPWEGANEVFGGTTEVAGVAIIDRAVLFAGRNGMGPFCYGQGTGDARVASEPRTDGEKFCYDPTSNDKGQHAFPYRLQFWAYDINDLAAVRAGRRDPWEVKPYAVWPFELPAIGDPYPRIGAVAYDASRRRLFLTQLFGDKDGYARRPIVHVFTVRE